MVFLVCQCCGFCCCSFVSFGLFLSQKWGFYTFRLKCVDSFSVSSGFFFPPVLWTPSPQNIITERTLRIICQQWSQISTMSPTPVFLGSSFVYTHLPFEEKTFFPLMEISSLLVISVHEVLLEKLLNTGTHDTGSQVIPCCTGAACALGGCLAASRAVPQQMDRPHSVLPSNCDNQKRLRSLTHQNHPWSRITFLR